jgi:hypothetical protein
MRLPEWHAVTAYGGRHVMPADEITADGAAEGEEEVGAEGERRLAGVLLVAPVGRDYLKLLHGERPVYDCRCAEGVDVKVILRPPCIFS